MSVVMLSAVFGDWQAKLMWLGDSRKAGSLLLLCLLLALVKLLRLPLLLSLVLGHLLPTCLPLQRAGEKSSMLSLQQILEGLQGHCAACTNILQPLSMCMHVTIDVVFSFCVFLFCWLHLFLETLKNFATMLTKCRQLVLCRCIQ